MTITEFLLARIAEDEDAARRSAGDESDWIDSEHQQRWQPARVLAECAAKRRIVEKVEGLGLRDDPRAAPWYQGYSFALKDVLKDLALALRRPSGLPPGMALGGITSGTINHWEAT